jgi:hypothetical protein
MDQNEMPTCLRGDCKGLGCPLHAWCNPDEPDLCDMTQVTRIHESTHASASEGSCCTDLPLACPHDHCEHGK